MNILNKGILATTLLCGAVAASASEIPVTESNPALLVIDGDTVTKGEFEYMYNKNNSSALNGPISPDEYLKLFIGYKRKAIDAVNQLYTSRSAVYKKEYNEYLKQVVSPYLMDEATENEFVKEAYNRLKESRSVSHILIKPKNGDKAAKAQIDIIYKKLQDGAKFADLAKEFSDCGSAERGGYLDFFTAFDMVYDFETVAYKTEPGHFSEPFKTQFGWHILQVHDVKKNYTKAHVKEIFIGQTGQKAKSLADSIKGLLDKGVKFEKLVKKYSDRGDKAKNKGDLGWISTENTPGEYVNQVYTIQHDGEVKVIPSPVGMHIVKLVEGVTTPPLDSASYESLRKNVARSDRYDVVMKKNRKELAVKHGFIFHDEVADKLSSLLWTPVYEVEDSLKKYDTPLYEFDGTSVVPSNFAKDIIDIQHAYHNALEGQMVMRIGAKIDTTASLGENIKREVIRLVEKEAEQLEIESVKKKNIDVAYQLQEYSDGLLVYGISKETIWDKGVNQPDSLEKFFQEHRDKYKFKEDRFVGHIFCMADSMTMVKIKTLLETKKPNVVDARKFVWNELNLTGAKDGVSRDGAWVKGKSKLCDRYVYNDTTAHPTEIEKYPYVYVYGSITKEPMKAAQIRGQVLADYQKVFEDKYNAYLEERYPVTLFKEVFEQIKKENK